MICSLCSIAERNPVWNSLSKSWQNFLFWMNHPFKTVLDLSFCSSNTQKDECLHISNIYWYDRSLFVWKQHNGWENYMIVILGWAIPLMRSCSFKDSSLCWHFQEIWLMLTRALLTFSILHCMFCVSELNLAFLMRCEKEREKQQGKACHWFAIQLCYRNHPIVPDKYTGESTRIPN